MNKKNTHLNSKLGDKHISVSPDISPIGEMSKDELKAFEEGTWDGIEKRSDKNPKKEELAAKRRLKRRQKDRQNAIVYYSVLSILFIMAFIMIAGTVVFQMSGA